MSDTLPVVETFHSLQGEGHHTGRSAFFIRLAGCTVGCPWCDTKHSWPESAHPRRPITELIDEAAHAVEAGAEFTVITGGEPLHHNLEALTNGIREATKQPLHLETSGVDSLSGHFDWITLSPKRHRPPQQELLEQCHELKVVIQDNADLVFAEAMAERVRPNVKLLLQAEWSRAKAQQLVIQRTKKSSRWRLSHQLHKSLGIR
jgi:7-carboxy-7-deazaguanine synthase